MALDERANFAKGLLSAGIDDSVTSLSLGSGEGALFPTPTVGYSCVIWDIDTYANPADDPGKEIVRVTEKSTDTFTITRAQESTSASAHSAGAGFMLTVTAKTITDIETALGTKVDKEAGKGLSSNDYTTTEKNKLFGIAEGAEVNVNADWNASSGDAQILNKPTIPTVDSTSVAAAGAVMASSKAAASDINTGTDDTKYLTSDGLAGSTLGTKNIQIKVCDDATALTTGDGKIIFCIPPELNGMNLVDADAMVSTVSSSGAPLIQIRNVTDSADMLSTRITIDATEFTSYTAETAPVIDASHDDVATGDLIAIDVDGAGTGAKGLTILLSFRLP